MNDSCYGTLQWSGRGCHVCITDSFGQLSLPNPIFFPFSFYKCYFPIKLLDSWLSQHLLLPDFNLCHPKKTFQFYWHIFISHRFLLLGLWIPSLELLCKSRNIRLLIPKTNLTHMSVSPLDPTLTSLYISLSFLMFNLTTDLLIPLDTLLLII